MPDPRIRTEKKDMVSIFTELRAELEKQADTRPVGIYTTSIVCLVW